jgi:Na+/H+ antiporter NhaD/arsenite permease-like protein
MLLIDSDPQFWGRLKKIPGRAGPGQGSAVLHFQPLNTTLIVFTLVYLGMFLGRLPGLALDRTGFALLGAIALVAFGGVSVSAAWTSVDVPTIALLFGLMVVSAQFRLGGFYSAVTARLAERETSPGALLGSLVIVAGVLSALLANDIVCLAMTPVLASACERRGLDPVPFLLALAAAANVGSAATLIGNPQNMLIGQALGMSFGGYLLDAAVPSALGLGAVWWIIGRRYSGRWHRAVVLTYTEHRAEPFDRSQTLKGALVLGAVVVALLVAPVPREAVALTAAGMLLLSRRMASRDILGLVDWQLLVLFVGLFVVNHALMASGLLARATDGLRSAGVPLDHGAWLFGVTAALSNLVSNVPAVMLLLKVAKHPQAGPILALSSTLAGNLLLVGSIANIIVAEQAARQGVRIGWREHARVGVPITAVTLALAAGWLWLRAAM